MNKENTNTESNVENPEVKAEELAFDSKKFEEAKKTKANAPKENDEPVLSEAEELAKLRIELAKQKRALDKASHDTAEYKRQLRERQTADEVAAQEKAEAEAMREEELKRLRRENQIAKFEKNFLSLGYSEDFANKAAIAQYDNDTDALFDIQAKVMEAMEKGITAKLLKTQQIAPISNSSEVNMTQQEFDKLTYLEQVEFKNKYPEIWEKFA